MSDTEIIGEVPPQPELTPEQLANRLNVEFHFPSGMYWIAKPEFLETAKFVSKEYLNKAKKDKPKDKLMDKFNYTLNSLPTTDGITHSVNKTMTFGLGKQNILY